MITRKPQISYDDALAVQPAKKASKEKLPVKGVDFASLMQAKESTPRAAQPADTSAATAPRIESATDLRMKRPTIRSNTAPITGRGDIAMLPRGSNTMLAAATTKAGGNSTMTGRPAMAAPNALALQAQGMAQEKVQQNFQGMGVASGSKNLASHSLLSQNSGKGVFSPEVTAQLDAQLAGQTRKNAQNANAAAKPRAQSGRVLENSTQPLRAVNSLNELRARELKPIVHPKARAAKTAASQDIPQGILGNSPLLAGESTQALLRAFKELNLKVEHSPSPGLGGGSAASHSGLGSLSARFESGAEGSAAIGYDRHGGTSYGKYQISSRAGTMRSFLGYLDKTAPDLGKRLRSAGTANTGSRNGAMPNAWRQIATEQPARFERLQDDFIRKSHLEPAMHAVTQSTGLGFAELAPALQEVVFSTAVQHGPGGAARILDRAMSKVDTDKLKNDSPKQERNKAGNDLIRNIYSIRSTQFRSSSLRVQSSVKNRLRQEMNAALEMLKA